MSGLLVAQVGAAVVVLGGVAGAWAAIARSGVRHERAVLKEHARAYRAHYAAVEAAEDDPSFSPDAIELFVSEVVELADTVWRADGRGALEGCPDARIIRTWARSRESWLGSVLQAVGKPTIDLLQVVNRDDDDEDRVAVRVRVRVHCKHPRVGLVATRYMALDERWTLGHRDGRWVLLEMGGDPLAGPVLTAPLVPDPSADTERLREESLAELASKQKVGDDVALSDLVSADEPPALALFDLSLLDGRFDPSLIASELAHLLEAWQVAVTGSEAPLEQLATSHARAALLRPGHGTRLIVRDAVLKSWEPTRLELAHQPPAIEVALNVEAVRYVVANDGSHRAGNQADPRQMDLAWTLERTDSAQVPWRLTRSNNPAEAIAGWP